MKTLFKFIFFILFFCFLVSCDNQLLPSPNFGSSLPASNTTSENILWGAPQNIMASQGVKGKITLSWSGIPKAIRYDIFSATNPFETFKQVAETNKDITNKDFFCAAGTTTYYKVRAAKSDGTTSDFSTTVCGTSLAQPVISLIEKDKASGDSTIRIYWWMNNVNSETYEKNVRYIIQCSDEKGSVVAEKTLNGAETSDTFVTFTNLNPSTKYFFTVEAFNVNDHNQVEISEIVDAETARRLRPDAPQNLIASKGNFPDKVELSFILPNFVDVALGNGVYKSEKIYFKVYRQIYNENENSENFIEIASNLRPAEYIPGEEFSFIDNSIKRGLRYIYKVQSFADTNRIISSDFSIAQTIGWPLTIPSFNVTNTNPVKNEDETAIIKNSVGFKLVWETFNMEDNYNFILQEIKTDLESDGSTVHEAQNRKFNSISELNNFIRIFELTGASPSEPKDRGYYNYTLKIVDAHDNNSVIESIDASKRVFITDSTQIHSIDDFSIIDGYKDKFLIKWKYDNTCEYKLEYVKATKELDQWIVDSFSTAAIEVALDTFLETATNGTVICFEDSAVSGDARKYKLTAIRGFAVEKTSDDLQDEPFQTLGKANITWHEPEYDKINISWAPVQKAQKYSIYYEYEYDEYVLPEELKSIRNFENNANISLTGTLGYIEKEVSDISNIESDGFVLNDDGSIFFSILNPIGFHDARVAGRHLRLCVKAENTVDSEQIVTESFKTNVYVLGPALTNASASKATDTSKIIVSWNKISGAQGYAVKRSRLSLDCSTSISTDSYVVSASDCKITLNNEDVNSNTTQAIDLGSNITLQDYYKELINSDSSYDFNQDKIAWGFPYRYTIIPLKNKEDNVASLIDYTNIDDVSDIGSALGYGHNVNASKAEDPRKIIITWDKPYLGKSSSNPTLWKTVSGTNNWHKTDVVLDASGDKFIYIPKGIDRTESFDFAIKYQSDSLVPKTTYLAELKNTENTDSFGEAINKGYTFAIDITATNVPENGKSSFSERITWNLYDTVKKKRAPETDYIISVKNLNNSPNWQNIASINITTGQVIISNPDIANTDISTLGNTISLSAKKTSATDVNKGLLYVLRDYKHYVAITTTRTGLDSQIITCSFSDDDNVFAFRKITETEFARCIMLAVAEGFNKSSYPSGTISGGAGTFSLKNKDWKIWYEMINFQNRYLTYPGQEDLSTYIDAFFTIDKSGWTRCGKTTGVNSALSDFDSANLNVTKFYDYLPECYSGIVTFTGSKNSVNISVTQNGVKTDIISISGDEVNRRKWLPIKWYSDSSTLYGSGDNTDWTKSSEYGWW